MKTISLLILSTLLLTCSGSNKLNQLNEEEKLIMEVLELDILEANDPNKRIWVNSNLSGSSYWKEGEVVTVTGLRKFSESYRDGDYGHLSDSLFVEKFCSDYLGLVDVDTIWTYSEKLDILQKLFTPCPSLQLKNAYFKNKKISCRKKTFNTWNYGNPVVVKNGEFVILRKGKVCGTLCSYSGFVIFQRKNKKWVRIPSLIMVS